MNTWPGLVTAKSLHERRGGNCVAFSHDVACIAARLDSDQRPVPSSRNQLHPHIHPGFPGPAVNPIRFRLLMEADAARTGFAKANTTFGALKAVMMARRLALKLQCKGAGYAALPVPPTEEVT